MKIGDRTKVILNDDCKIDLGLMCRRGNIVGEKASRKLSYARY